MHRWPPRQLPIYRLAARASRASTSSTERRPREGVDQTSSSATAAARRNDNLARLSAVVRRNGEGAAALRRARGARAAESRRAREGVQDVDAASAAPRAPPRPGPRQAVGCSVPIGSGQLLWPQCRLEKFPSRQAARGRRERPCCGRWTAPPTGGWMQLRGSRKGQRRRRQNKKQKRGKRSGAGRRRGNDAGASGPS